MHTLRSIIISFLLILLVMDNSVAQGEWPLQHIDKKSGLSNSAINAIYLDRNDYVWIGTWDGLNRYDGDAITSYKPIAGDNHSISNNIIRQILEDKAGNLWIVTHDGINRYDRNLNRFHRYLNNLEHLPFLENNLQAVLSDDSTIYISLIGWGIGKYSPETDGFEAVHPSEGVFKNAYRIGNHEGYLYLLGNNGKLVSYSENGDLQSNPINLPSNLLFSKLMGMDGRYFLLYQKGSGDFMAKELKNGRVISSHELNTIRTSVTGIAQSKDKKQLYLGTDEGQLLQLGFQGDSLISTSLSKQSPSLERKKLKIFSIHESTQNILWVGTDGDGVYKYLTKESAFYSIGEGNASDGKISNSIVRSIHVDQNETLYLGTRSGGLNLLKKDAMQTEVYDKTNGLSDNTVLALANDSKGNIWIGLDSEGLDMMESDTKKILHFPRDFTNGPDSLYFGSVYEILVDSYGHIWLGTSGYGVVYLDISKNSAGTYELNETYSINPESGDRFGSIQVKSNIVYALEQEEANILWFGARNGGLYRYNTLSRTITHNLQAETEGRFALNNNDILSLYIDTKNQLWVGSSGGLNKVNLSNFNVEQYSQNDGLANNTIHGILEDYLGRLWLSSNNGLFAFDPSNNTFKNFNWTDGLTNYEYTDGAYFKTAGDRRLLFGGTKGLDVVEPSRLDTSFIFPRLALIDLFISNVRITPGDSSGILSASVDLQNQIALTYNQNFLSLTFTTLDYWHKQRCSYRYFLEGFDKNWIDLGKQSMISLTNIPPGRYTLHLNNTNENGDWNPDIRKISINISPPFWATRLAYTFYFILAMITQFGLIQFLRNRAKRKKALEIERIKNEQGEIIQRYKLEFFTNVAHEFRTPLTLILGPVVALLEKTKTTPALNEPMQTIYRNSLRLQKLIQELIQFRKVELGKEKLNLRSIDLIPLLEELLQSFQQYATEKDITLTREAPKTLRASVDSDILEKILINLISNALKYTDQGGEVQIKVLSENNNIKFSIADTGIGIQEHELSIIFERFNNIPHEGSSQTANSAGIGLSLTKKLILLHQGDIDVQSTPGQGSVFTFWIPAFMNQAEQEPTHSEEDKVILNKLGEHLQSEFYDVGNFDREMIDISLERFEYSILVVDDNIQILHLIRQLLSPKYNIILCTSGSEALGVLAHRKIDLIISDVIMPEMDGYMLCEKVKSRIETSHIPVILLTAKGDIEERIEGLQAGADAYIPKPFHPDHLNVRIQKLIQTRELLKNKFDSYALTESEFSSFGIGSRDDEFFKQVDLYIKGEMSNPDLDAQHIAQHIGMSKTSLYKKIRALTGQTPHAMINQYRLKQAAFLLTNTDLNVSEIINRTGFNSRSYFYKSFQEMFHCSPTSYTGETLK